MTPTARPRLSAFTASHDAIDVENIERPLKSRARTELLGVLPAYLVLAVAVLAVKHVCTDLDFSSVLTLGAAVQACGFYCLLVKVQRQKSVAGISLKTLRLYAAVLACRLGSTLTHSGYLPADHTGDYFYQFADLVSLAIVLLLLRCMVTSYAPTYQESFDSMEVLRVIPACIVFAISIHGNLNNSFVFDTMWTLAMNLDTVAMAPQLWMVAKLGEVECMTSHYVAGIFLSRACSFAFWFYGYRELESAVRGPVKVNVAGWQLLVAHALQLVLSADFLFYYVRARIKGGRMRLPIQV
jgi:hypothetical protein